MIYDLSDLSQRRKVMGVVALAIFLLCFMLAPIETAGGL
jgi:hypothetical protein